MNERPPTPTGRRPLITLAVAALLLGNPGVFAAETPAPAVAPARPTVIKPAGFDAFRLIGERNIFNPNRVGRSRGSDAPPPRLDTIALVGVMQYEKGLFAFFDGSEANYRKTLQAGGTVGQYTVTRISPDGVELMHDKKPLTLKISDQLRRPEGGEWTLVMGDVARNDPRPAEADAAHGDAPPAPVAIPADASDTLKRLMEQRQKQMKQ